MNKTKNIVLTGLMIALGIVIVSVLKNFGGQPILRLFSPMHIPVLIAGLAIGPIEGILCGFFTPLLSYLINGLPPAGPFAMMAELSVYGFVTGYVMHKVEMGSFVKRMYIGLVCAMLLGRVAGGLVQGLIMSPMAGNAYSLQAWFSAYFVATAPAIVFDLIIIPILVGALKKANLIRN